MAKVRITPVAPIGKCKTMAFVNRGRAGCSFENIELDVFPDSPDGKKLRARRHELDMSLRQLANLLGISPVETSGLETGSHTVDDWAELFRVLEST
jgi:hypothetical protein